MNIGIIKYRKYEERVLLDTSFVTVDLLKIILSDKDYIKFQIVDEIENLLLSTDFSETGKDVAYLNVAKVKRVEEILGTTYNAYKTPAYSYKTKVRWTVNGGICKTKKQVQGYADKINLKARLLIEKFVETGTINAKN
jgi:hypothetical protein